MAPWTKKEEKSEDQDVSDGFDIQEGVLADNADGLQRHLANRQIQLIAIGGSIGTALFISIGQGLYYGGPGSLLIAYTAQSIALACVNNSIAEMSVAFPVSGGFIRLAGKWVDDALGFMTGWNFFFYEALLIPFEISALNLVISYWSDSITDVGPTAGICIACIVLYALINILAVRAYGEAEFWLSGGKVILIFSLFFYTFITMVGGNPENDAYGFRYFGGGRAFQPLYPGETKSLAQFEGFLAALWQSAFTVVGPEYISIVAAEARRPRVYIKTAFKTVYFRFGLFFIGGALAVGIVCNSEWPRLEQAVSGGGGTAAASPYVISMQVLNVKVFPDIVNALMLTSIFSAGNTYTYAAVRSLYGLALEGRAPKFLRYTTKKGVPLWCFCVVMAFPFLSFLAVSNGAESALSFISTLVTAGGTIDYIVMCITFIRFHKACKVQGLDRRSLPYFGYLQPYCAWYGLCWMIMVTLFYGYSVFRNGEWSTKSFFGSYCILGVDAIIFVIWKIWHRTKFIKPNEVDLVWERPTIDAYEATFIDPPVGFWREMLQLFGLYKVKGGNDKRVGSISN